MQPTLTMSEPTDKQIARIANHHGGHVARVQLLNLGLGAKAIAYRLLVGRLIAVHNGVYAVGRLPTTPSDQAAGALLACGGKGVLSGWSAAYLWEMERRWRLPIEVTVAVDRRPKGLRVHRAKLTRADIRINKGLWMTSPARTILDIAPRLSDKRLARVVNESRLSHQIGLTPSQLADVVQRFPRHPGASRLRPFAETDQEPTRSELEDALKRFLDHFGLPQPAIIAGYRVDAYFELERLIVEVDGWQAHRTKAAFEADRLQDGAILAATGIPTVRITYDRLTRLAKPEADRLRRILADRRPR